MCAPKGPLRLDNCPDVFDFETLRRLVPLSPTTLRDLTRRELIPSIRAGRRVLYSRDALRAWLAGDPTQRPQTPAVLPLSGSRRGAR